MEIEMDMDMSNLLTPETALQVMDKVCLVLTLFVLFSGMGPCITMYKRRDTKNVPIQMFFITAASCAGMFHYAILIDNSTMLLINGIGTLLQCSYILIYLLVTPDTGATLLFFALWNTISDGATVTVMTTIMSWIAAAGVYGSTLYYYIFNVAEDEESMAAALGSTSCLLNISNYAVMAVELRQNFLSRNADGTPSVMVFSGLACALSWLIYGTMLDDPYIYTPNIPGLIVGLGKAYVIYSFSRDETTKTD